MSAPITIDQQLACIRREIALRKNVYRRRVARDDMRQSEADHEIAAMTAVLATVEEHKRWSAPHSDLAGTKPLVLYFPSDEARQEFMDAVKEAKPGMAEFAVP